MFNSHFVLTHCAAMHVALHQLETQLQTALDSKSASVRGLSLAPHSTYMPSKPTHRTSGNLPPLASVSQSY